MLSSVTFEYVAATGGFAGEQISEEEGVVPLIPSFGFCCCGVTVTWFYYCRGVHAVLR